VSDETDAVLHTTLNLEIHAVGTGSVTGTRYLFHDVFHDSENRPNVSSPHFTEQYTRRRTPLLRALWTTASSASTSTSLLPGKVS
jgi:hypothetical protein